MHTYGVSNSWRVEEVDGDYQLFGGDDAIVIVEKNSFSERVFSGHAVSRESLAYGQLAQFEQLLSSGILEPELKPKPNYTVYIEDDGLPFRLGEIEGVTLTDNRTGADYALVIRYKSELGRIVNRIADLELVHLLVDVAFHHTISVGPIVVPHETPCIACLYGRLRERWGVAEPAQQPWLVEQYPDLVKAVIKAELKRLLEGDMSLVGKTSSLDVINRKVLNQKLLTVTDCPYCVNNRPIDGRIDL